MNRRHIISATALAVASFALPAQAQDYKGKTIKVVVPAPPGSAPDVIARIVTDSMRQTLGATVIIENKQGAGGIIAVNQVKGAAADGLTLLMPQGAVVAISPHTYKEAKFDFERDFDAVAAVADTPMMIAANPTKGPASLSAALTAAKAKPDGVAFGNPVRTSIPHLTAEMMDQTMGTKFQQIPMGTTSQGIQAVVNGDIVMYIDGVAPIMPMVKAGRLKALAVTSSKELDGLEGIPLAKDVVPNLVVSGWFAIFAPKGTPASMINQLNAAANTAVQNPDVIAKLRNLGTYPMGGSVADAQAFVKKEKAMWADVIRKSGIQPE
jgi:tripartite-type tricarboxylate transporter receptor subunit TctC